MYILAFSILIANAVIAQKSEEVAINKMLQTQVEAWNKGNIEKFMVGYWESDSLLFIGKNGPKYGYNTTLSNYKKSYPDTISMGKLKSDIISMQKISPKCFFVVGKWHLTRSIGNIEGHYTLLIRKINGKWVVVADHSS